MRAIAVRALVVLAAGAAIAGCGGGGGGGTVAATPATGGAPSAPQQMPAAEAAKVLAPILARAQAGGYETFSRTDRGDPTAGFAEKGGGFGGNVTVWASPAAGRTIERTLAQEPESKSGQILYAVIGNRQWIADARINPGVSDLRGSFRRLIEVAEGCGSSCDFSHSNVK